MKLSCEYGVWGACCSRVTNLDLAWVCTDARYVGDGLGSQGNRPFGC